MEKVKKPEERIWYIQKTAENGWSHDVLVHQIESGLYQRQIFPNWKYISANASPTVADMSIMKAERVYFFTDTIGHSNYYKFIHVVREHDIPFSYMHGVNIEGNIRQIYDDMRKGEK